MKKTLLTIAILGSSLFASAQLSTIATYDTSGSTSQSFDVGQQPEDHINDSSIVAITSASGTVATNNGFFGVLASTVSGEEDDATGTFTFTVTTNSTTAKDLNFSFDLAKRRGNTASGNITIDGTSTAFSFASNGDTTQGVGNESVTFSQSVSVSSSSPAIVVINLTSLTKGSVTTTHATTFRFTKVTVTDAATLSIDETLVNKIKANVTPNPVTNTFSIDNESVESVKLYNIAGQLVKTFNKQVNYNVSDLSTGVYFVNVNTEVGSKTIKFLKK